MMFPMLAVPPHGASPSQCTEGWELLMANGHIRKNHQRCRFIGVGSTGNPDTGWLPPMDAIFNIMLPNFAGRSVTGENWAGSWWAVGLKSKSKARARVALITLPLQHVGSTVRMRMCLQLKKYTILLPYCSRPYLPALFDLRFPLHLCHGYNTNYELGKATSLLASLCTDLGALTSIWRPEVTWQEKDKKPSVFVKARENYREIKYNTKLLNWPCLPASNGDVLTIILNTIFLIIGLSQTPGFLRWSTTGRQPVLTRLNLRERNTHLRVKPAISRPLDKIIQSNLL